MAEEDPGERHLFFLELGTETIPCQANTGPYPCRWELTA